MHALAAIFTASAQDITWWQMAARGVAVFFFAVILLRLLYARVFGRFAAIDTTVAILLGSTLSRALTGNARFAPALATVAILMGLHAVLVWATGRSPALSRLVKGREKRLVANGQMQHDVMRRAGISEDDLREALRLRAGQAELGGIDAAYLERDGSVSFIRAHGPDDGTQARRGHVRRDL